VIGSKDSSEEPPASRDYLHRDQVEDCVIYCLYRTLLSPLPLHHINHLNLPWHDIPYLCHTNQPPIGSAHIVYVVSLVTKLDVVGTVTSIPRTNTVQWQRCCDLSRQLPTKYIGICTAAAIELYSMFDN